MIPRSRPGPRSSRVRFARRWLLVVGLVVVAAGCGQPGPSPSTGIPASSASSPGSSRESPPNSSIAATPSSSGPASAPHSLPPGVSVDPGLLEVLPAEVDGVTLVPDSGTAAEIGSNLLLVESARSIAVAVAAAPGASGADDFAIASVVRLLPDVYDEAFFQEWRDSYDEAACGVADGVESADETQIGGRQVYTATCVGGARTYHAYLEDQGFIVSITATGERRLGERIMANLAG